MAELLREITRAVLSGEDIPNVPAFNAYRFPGFQKYPVVFNHSFSSHSHNRLERDSIQFVRPEADYLNILKLSHYCYFEVTLIPYVQ